MKRVLLLAALLTLTVGVSPQVARFGYLAPTSRESIWQSVLDRYASDIEQRFAQTAPASLIVVTAAEARNGSAKACQALGISGFVEPHAHWSTTQTEVSVEAELVVRDCNGNLFYQGTARRTAIRDNTMLPQTQIDEVQGFAATALLQKFETYRAAHAPAWAQLLNSGLIPAQ
jgi:hypothetical protein